MLLPFCWILREKKTHVLLISLQLLLFFMHVIHLNLHSILVHFSIQEDWFAYLLLQLTGADAIISLNKRSSALCFQKLKTEGQPENRRLL